MKITLLMLFVKLFEKYPDLEPFPFLKDETAVVSGLCLYPGVPVLCGSGCLYLYDQLPEDSMEEYPPDFFLLCITAAPSAPSKNPRVMVLSSDLPFAEVFNVLQNVYISYLDWGKQLELATLRCSSMQEIVDLSEDILDNPVLILDPSLKMLAHSKYHHADDDPTFSYIVKHGYMSPVSVRNFEEDHTFESVYQSGFLSSAPNKARRYSDMIEGIKLKDESIIYVVLLHKNTADKAYVTHLFKNFTYGVKDVFQHQKANFHAKRYMEDYFLADLLKRKDIPLETIHERLEYIHLPFRGHFLFCMLYSNAYKTTSEQYFLNILRSHLPDDHIFPYNKNLAILINMPASEVLSYRRYVRKHFLPAQKTLLMYEAKICVSKPFSAIDKLFAAKRQTANCHLLSDKDKNSSSLLFYEDYVLDNLFFDNKSSSDLLYDFCSPVIYQMQESSDEKTQYHLSILECYLRNECKPTETAAALNMHRNNIIYHIQQIQDKYLLNLHDPQLRLELLLSFALLRYVKEPD